MIIFKYIEIKNFRNIKHLRLEDLRDLNILIGPNNCGKTNFLEFILKLSQWSLGGTYLCEECRNLQGVISSSYIPITIEDFYMNDSKRKMQITFLFNEEEIDRLVPKIVKKQREKLENKTILCKFIKDEIVMENEGENYLSGKHISPFISEGVIQEISNSILYCPERRLENYKGADFREYIRNMHLRISQKRKWIDFLQRVVDPKIDDEKYENLIRKVDGEDFETEISKQGSGVRSLICLAADILFSQNKRIILIDEPELGLNPFAKQEFLKFLLEESKEKQIFIATQDPTIVNPILWKNDNVSVYFYSIVNEEFLKIDLKQNQEDPAVFTGYLPHTVSLKDIHIYVEGTSDVYIFQILLEKYLKETLPENWFQVLNRVGIYHLCGDFWIHLLYTIPKHPYKCIIIMDGDKRETAKEICEKHNKSLVIASKFSFCERIDDVGLALSKGIHPLYCLKENCIEKYIIPNFDCANPPQNYNKRIHGPKKAEELTEIPNEIRQLFEIIFGTLGLGPKRYVFIEEKLGVLNIHI